MNRPSNEFKSSSVHTVTYKSSKGELDIDQMSETHLRNVLKKLVRDKAVPEGTITKNVVDISLCEKAIRHLADAKTAIATMGLTATVFGEEHWEQQIDTLTKVQIELSEQLKFSENN